MGLITQLGPKLKIVIVDSSHLTNDFIARMEELRLHLVISGWDGPEDYALVHEADPKPWSAALDSGFSAFTDRPDLVIELLQ